MNSLIFQSPNFLWKLIKNKVPHKCGTHHLEVETYKNYQPKLKYFYSLCFIN